MAFSLNRQEIIGLIGRDAEVRFLTNGDQVLNFSVATTNSYKKNNEWVNETDWHNVVRFGEKLEGLANYLKKGKKVYVSGRPKVEKYTNKEGKEVTAIKLMADTIIPLEKADGTAAGQQTATEEHTATQHEPEMPEENDDLPF